MDTALTTKELKLLKQAFAWRIDHLNTIVAKCAGNLYPRIYGKEVDDLEELFEKLAGCKIEDSDELD